MMADANWNFVLAAYAVTWTVLIVYGVFVHRTLASARRRYERADLTRSLGGR
jgi:hypothetical protein